MADTADDAPATTPDSGDAGQVADTDATGGAVVSEAVLRLAARVPGACGRATGPRTRSRSSAPGRRRMRRSGANTKSRSAPSRRRTDCGRATRGTGSPKGWRGDSRRSTSNSNATESNRSKSPSESFEKCAADPPRRVRDPGGAPRRSPARDPRSGARGGRTERRVPDRRVRSSRLPARTVAGSRVDGSGGRRVVLRVVGRVAGGRRSGAAPVRFHRTRHDMRTSTRPRRNWRAVFGSAPTIPRSTRGSRRHATTRAPKSRELWSWITRTAAALRHHRNLKPPADRSIARRRSDQVGQRHTLNPNAADNTATDRKDQP